MHRTQVAHVGRFVGLSTRSGDWGEKAIRVHFYEMPVQQNGLSMSVWLGKYGGGGKAKCPLAF